MISRRGFLGTAAVLASAGAVSGRIQAAGIPEVTLHAARHSSVTAMRDAGVPDHVVAAWHGHDENIMPKAYSHAQPSGLSEAGAILERIFGALNAKQAS